MSASEGPSCYVFLMFTVLNPNFWTVIKEIFFNVASSLSIVLIVFEMLACGYYWS